MEEIHIKLLKAVIFRLSNELTIKTKINEHSLIAIKCFNLIKTFVENKFYTCSAGFPLLEQELLPIYQLLKQKDFSFVDDVIIIVGTIIKVKKKVTNHLAFIVPEIYNIFESKKRILDNLFSTINGFLVYGNEVFLEQNTYIEIVKTYLKIYLLIFYRY